MVCSGVRLNYKHAVRAREFKCGVETANLAHSVF